MKPDKLSLLKSLYDSGLISYIDFVRGAYPLFKKNGYIWLENELDYESLYKTWEELHKVQLNIARKTL